MTLNREHFEAWLFAQPPSREFCYWEDGPEQLTGCCLCNYFRETIATPHYKISTKEFLFENDDDWQDFPDWLCLVLPKQSSLFDRFTAGDVQTRYLSLFPNTLSDTLSLPGAKAGILSSEQRESTQGKIDSHEGNKPSFNH